MTLPFVSCVMPTTASRAWCAPLAVEAFHAQSWPADRRELVVVTEPEDLDAVRAAVDGAGAFARIETVPRTTIGAKYNFAIAAARGPVVALWEDDDIHGPTRLADQLESWERVLRAPRSRKLPAPAFTASHRLTYWDLPTDEVRVLDASPGWCHGTFLGMRAAWLAYPYPELDAGNDGVWMRAVEQRYAIHPFDVGDRYVATRHGGNTWKPTSGTPFLRTPRTADEITPRAAEYRDAFTWRAAA